MANALGRYLRNRADDLGISLAEVARRSGKSRQTMHSIGTTGGRLPELQTLIELAVALDVHPLRLIHLVFEDYHLPSRPTRQHTQRGDSSIFLSEVTIPDSAVVIVGSRFAKIWELQNLGTMAWENRYLRCMDEEIIVTNRAGEQLRIAESLHVALNRVEIPFTAPGGVARLSVDFVAPSLPGVCVSYWKSFFADGRACFPNSVELTCKVRVLSMEPISSRPEGS